MLLIRIKFIIEKVQVIIDTLRGLNKQGENKIDGVE